MTTETLLTDEEIGRIAVAQGCDPDRDDGALVMRLCRAIEQAILQSPEVKAWKRDAECVKELERFIDLAFSAHPNLDLDVAAIDAARRKGGEVWPK